MTGVGTGEIPQRPAGVSTERQTAGREAFLAALQANGGVITRAAEAAGISITTVRRWRRGEQDFENATQWAMFESGDEGRARFLKREAYKYLRLLRKDGKQCFNEVRDANGKLIRRSKLYKWVYPKKPHGQDAKPASRPAPRGVKAKPVRSGGVSRAAKSHHPISGV